MKRLFYFDRKFIMIPVLAVYLLGVSPFDRAVFFARSALALAVLIEHDAQRISSKCDQYSFQAVLVKGKMPGLFYCCSESVYPVDQRSSRRSAAAADQSSQITGRANTTRVVVLAAEPLLSGRIGVTSGYRMQSEYRYTPRSSSEHRCIGYRLHRWTRACVPSCG